MINTNHHINMVHLHKNRLNTLPDVIYRNIMEYCFLPKIDIPKIFLYKNINYCRCCNGELNLSYINCPCKVKLSWTIK
jgi:hypothetical protein